MSVPVREEKKAVDGQQQDVASDKDPAASDPVGERADRHREQHEDARRCDVEQRQEAEVEIECVLELDVDECVADRRDRQCGSGQGQRPEARAA